MSSQKKLGPHIYAIADRSYRQMMAGGKGKSQAVLISGESGAGKTESTKIVMLYLTTLGSNPNDTPAVDEKKDEETSVMERVMQSNPILEAFGNAKTLRNDNSSRFGKYIELGFTKRGVLMGAKVQTYLLEKVRIGFHGSGERTYHIFYQVLRGATPELRAKFRFENDTGGLELAAFYHATGQGGAPNLRVTDEECFQETLDAMRSMNWPEERIENVQSVIAGLLHLGQIKFNAVAGEGDEVAEIANKDVAEIAAELLGVDLEKFNKALTERKMVTRGEALIIPLSPAKAGDARDAIAKVIFGAMFLWVVEQVNNCCGWKDTDGVRSSIGVLDIFGFESFAINSFEQLCINFTNEALQQQFNKFIFKMEQEEYETEQINWDFVSFPDNQDVLDLIQKKPSGILSMLDDECRVPRGSDRNWCQRMMKEYIPKGNETEDGRFSATNVQKSKSIFCVTHFAGKVQYTAETGFLEKNKDEIPLTCKEMCETAPNQLVQDCYEVQRKGLEEATKSDSKKKGAAKSKTVAQQFKEQLVTLIQQVETTEPHYIRCLKPNDQAKPRLFQRRRTCEQLRCGGVLEAVRVARMGYPVRLSQSAFYSRYRMLLPSASEETLPLNLEDEEGIDGKDACVRLLDGLLAEGAKVVAAGGTLGKVEDATSHADKIRRMSTQPPPMTFPKEEVQLGLTKVFMRKPPHDSLESHKTFHQSVSATLIQAVQRGHTAYSDYQYMLAGALFIQRFYRGCRGRARWWALREALAALSITTRTRGYYHRRRYVVLRAGMVSFQAAYRGRSYRRLAAAVSIQTYYRVYLCRPPYLALRRAAIALQCRVRRGIAKAVLAGLQKAQKDIGSLKANNEQLKSEMASLKAMLAAQAKSQSSRKENQREMDEKNEEIEKLKARVAALEKQLEQEKTAADRLRKELATTRTDYEARLKRTESMVRKSSARSTATPPESPVATKKTLVLPQSTAPPSLPSMGTVDDAEHQHRLQQHLAEIARLEQQLEAERKSRRAADGELIKLKARASGVDLDERAVADLTMPAVEPKDESPPTSMRESLRESMKEKIQEEQEDDGREAVRSLSATDTAPEVTGSEEAKEAEIRRRQNAAKRSDSSSDAEVVEDEEMRQLKKESVTPQVLNALSKLGVTGADKNRVFEEKKETPPPQQRPQRGKLLRSPSEYFPMVRRGFAVEKDDKKEDIVVANNWKQDITSRKEREEKLRDEVRVFEAKLKKFTDNIGEGVEAVVWQLNRNTEGNEVKDDFTLKHTPILLKLSKKDNELKQAELTFTDRGNFLKKALGRGAKSVIHPLSLNEILEVKAGCAEYDCFKLPQPKSSSKSKSKTNDNTQPNLYLTLKASPTPLATSRLYFVKFMSRSSRNDLLNGLRGVLADMQIHEGVSISSIHTPNEGRRGSTGQRRRMPNANAQHPHEDESADPSIFEDDDDDEDPQEILVPLADVKMALNREREAYDRLLLLMLQGAADTAEKEDQVVSLHNRLDQAVQKSYEKDKVQENDSKLIMQLSKKLETLLMDNEDLRDQNDRLNSRLVAVECEKMNLMG